VSQCSNSCTCEARDATISRPEKSQVKQRNTHEKKTMPHLVHHVHGKKRVRLARTWRGPGAR
jgi:hypothetical protein